MRPRTLVVPLVAGFLLSGCSDDAGEAPDGGNDRDYRQDMRDFVQAISTSARITDSDFIIIPQNGHDLLTDNGEPDGPPDTAYLSAISGLGREDLFYGYDEDDVPTPAAETAFMIGFLDLAETHAVQVLVTDYCSTNAHMDSSYTWNARKGYVSFAANHRDLDNVPTYPAQPFAIHAANVTSLAQVSNFLYLLDPGQYQDKAALLSALRATNYDCLILDAWFDGEGGSEPLSAGDVASLKIKATGGTRLVIAYLSIGEAEDYRYYWQSAWNTDPPPWLAGPNPEWEGNYKVEYWDPGWQGIIFGTEGSYVARVQAAGFDGAYLDIIDAFEYFESLN